MNEVNCGTLSVERASSAAGEQDCKHEFPEHVSYAILIVSIRTTNTKENYI